MSIKRIEYGNYTAQMRWVIKGTYKDKKVELSWQDGKLSGDHSIIGGLLALAKSREGEHTGPVMGPYTLHNHLKDPLTSFFLAGGLFEEDPPIVDGDIPQPPKVPKGAVV